MTAIAIKPAHFPWFDYSRYSFSLGLKSPDRRLPLGPHRLRI